MNVHTALTPGSPLVVDRATSVQNAAGSNVLILTGQARSELGAVIQQWFRYVWFFQSRLITRCNDDVVPGRHKIAELDPNNTSETHESIAMGFGGP